MSDGKRQDFDDFTRGYLEALLWTNDPVPGSGEWDRWEETFPLLDAEDVATAIGDCADFQMNQAELLKQAGTPGQNGHDFFLTRNGHGTGFWDRGYPREVGRRLTGAAHLYGSHDVFLGEEG